MGLGLRAAVRKRFCLVLAARPHWNALLSWSVVEVVRTRPRGRLLGLLLRVRLAILGAERHGPSDVPCQLVAGPPHHLLLFFVVPRARRALASGHSMVQERPLRPRRALAQHSPRLDDVTGAHGSLLGHRTLFILARLRHLVQGVQLAPVVLGELVTEACHRFVHLPGPLLSGVRPLAVLEVDAWARHFSRNLLDLPKVAGDLTGVLVPLSKRHTVP
mmetsp:Transcript_6001/g.14326  ORF Transcript_6001/g.14326 Transcript_6001/m.14326 type:complete len:217 (-) Transcript_6001:96-746(-)